jgi:hypothetical protein
MGSVGPLPLQPACDAPPSSAASSQMANAWQPACDVTKYTHLVRSNSRTSSDQTATYPHAHAGLRAFVV